MGQTNQQGIKYTLPSQFAQYQHCPKTHRYINPKTNHSIIIQQFIFKGTHNRNCIENYYKQRKQISFNTSSQQQLIRLFEYDIAEVSKKAKQQNSTFRGFTDRNICSISARNLGKQEYSAVLFCQVIENSLQDEIYNRIGKNSFQEIELWSVLSSCVLGAINLLQQGLKEPMLSPKAIGLSKQGQIKVAQWEFIARKYLNKSIQEDGEIIVGETIQSKDQLQEILLSYYWPPQGIKALEGITNLGRKKVSSKSKQNNSSIFYCKLQIFSLGMTLISMCLRNCFYRAQTYSQKYLDKLIHQSIEIRKVQGKPLSKLMQKIIKETVKWDPQDRISYNDLKNLILMYFSDKQFSQQKSCHQSSYLSLSHISQNLSQQISRCDISALKNNMNKVLISQIYDENKKISIPISKKINECNFQNSFGTDMIFQGSGTIQQGLGDQQQIYQLQEDTAPKKQAYSSKNSNNSYSNNHQPKSLISSSRRQSKSFKNLAEKMNKHSQNSSFSNISNGYSSFREVLTDSPPTIGQIVQEMGNEYEDMPQNIQKCLLENEEDIQSPDLFVEFYEQEDGVEFITDRSQTSRGPKYQLQSPNFINKNKYRNQHNSSTKKGFIPQDSPIYEGMEDVSQDSCAQICQNIKTNAKNLFTDPKLLQYIRSPISSLENTLNNSVSFNKNSNIPLNDLASHGLSSNRNMQQNKQNIGIMTNKQNQWIRVQADQSSLPSQDRKYSHDGTHRIVKEEMNSGFYEGQKKNGNRSGYGVFFYNEGGKYRGNWLNNKMHGKGVLEYEDGRIAYEGQWYADQLHGKGILYNQAPINCNQALDFTNLDNFDQFWVYYDGFFEKDNKSGQGTLVLTNGQQFKGNFKQDLAHGYGEYYSLTGQMIRGLWQNNIFVGRID